VTFSILTFSIIALSTIIFSSKTLSIMAKHYDHRHTDSLKVIIIAILSITFLLLR
jgi:hypothetical protein